MSDASTSQPKLRRVLGTPSLVVFAIIYAVPLGFFTIYGIGVSMSQGHLATAYLITTVVVLVTGVSYARMARAIPTAGSAYAYARAGFGPHVGFVAGWTLLADYLLLPMINYLVIGLYMSAIIPSVPLWVWVVVPVLLTTSLNILGVKLMSTVNFIIGGAQLAFLALFIVLCFISMSGSEVPSLMSPLYSADFTFEGTLAVSALLVAAFVGFDALSALAEDTKDPERMIPRAILLTITILGVGTAVIVYIAQLAYPTWQFDDPETGTLELLGYVGGDLLNNLFVALFVAGCFASALSSQASGSRILYAMGRDGVLPKAFGALSRRFRTPVFNLAVLGAISLFALVISLTQVIELLSFGALFAYAVVNLAVIRCFGIEAWRKDGPSGGIKFIVLPAIGAASVIYLLTNLSVWAFIVGGIWLGLGILQLVFLTRGFRKPLPEMTTVEAELPDASEVH